MVAYITLKLHIIHLLVVQRNTHFIFVKKHEKTKAENSLIRLQKEKKVQTFTFFEVSILKISGNISREVKNDFFDKTPRK